MRKLLPRLVLVALLAALAWWLLEDRGPPDTGTAPVAREPPAEATTPSLRGLPPSHADAGSADGEGTTRSGGTEEPARALAGRARWWLEVDFTFCDAETGRRLDVPTLGGVERTEGVVEVSVRPAAPSGFVAFDRDSWKSPEVSWVERYAVVYPLRREIEAVIDIRRADGRALRDPFLGWRVPGRSTWEGKPADELPARLDGIPHFPGAYLPVEASDDDGLKGLARVRIPSRSDEVLHAEVVVSSDPEPEFSEGVVDDIVEVRGHVELEESIGEPPPPGVVDASVLRRDGVPADGVEVRLDSSTSTTDARGVARFVEVDCGNHEVALVQPGVVPVREKILVRSSRIENVRLVEPVGATLDVTVVSAKGEPLSFAEVTVHQASGVEWLDIDGDVQRLDRFTDERGYRRFEHVEPGRIVLITRWAGIVGRTTVRAKDAEVTQVRVVLSLGP